MKTLKKTLSLVLVLAMVLSFGAIAASAAITYDVDFSDQKDITYTEAVEVMVALGVIEGFDTGDFQPKGSFTREQAAKIICYMLLGPENVENSLAYSSEVPFNAPFNDVAANRWSAGYIRYCSAEGIIVGYGDGNFGPTDSLTAYAWAKMLLCALGYNAENEGLVGDSWMVKTSALAIRAGLVTGEELAATFNRELATKYAYNALTTKMVEYKTSGTTITTTDGTTVVTGGSTASNVANVDTKDYRINGSSINSTALKEYNDLYMQFCEQYFPKLKLHIYDADVFGRLGDTWIYDTTSIGFYGYTPVSTYTTTVTNSKVKSDASMNTGSYIDVYVDGVIAQEYKAGDKTTGDATYSGNGVLTEVYREYDTNNYRMVHINTYVGQVSKYVASTDSTKGTATVKLLSTYNAAPSGYYPTTNYGTGNLAATDGLVSDTYKTNDLEKYDIVYFTYADGKIRSIEVCDIVDSVKVTAVNDTTSNVNKNFTAGGETYYKSMYAGFPDGASTVAYGSTIDVYLDSYGYCIYVSTGAAATNWYYIVSVGRVQNADYTDGYYYYAKIVDLDGTVTRNVELSYASVTKLANVVENAGVYDSTKTVTSAGRYDAIDYVGFAQLTFSNADVATVGGTAFADYGDITITKNKTAFTPDTSITSAVVDASSGAGNAIYNSIDLYSATFYGSNSTVYILQTISYGVEKYAAYVGYANVPKITGTDVEISVVYGTNGVAECVFIGNGAIEEDVTDNYFIAWNTATTKYYSNNTYVVDVKAVHNGEIITVTIDQAVAENYIGSVAYSYVRGAIDSNGVIVRIYNALTSNTTTATFTGAEIASGLLTITYITSTTATQIFESDGVTAVLDANGNPTYTYTYTYGSTTYGVKDSTNVFVVEKTSTKTTVEQLGNYDEIDKTLSYTVYMTYDSNNNITELIAVIN